MKDRKIVPSAAFSMERVSYVKLMGIAWLLFTVCVGTLGSTVAYPAGSPTSSAYTLTFSTINFSSPFLQAASDDLSNPGQATFHLENESLLWYSIKVRRTRRKKRPP